MWTCSSHSQGLTKGRCNIKQPADREEITASDIVHFKFHQSRKQLALGIHEAEMKGLIVQLKRLRWNRLVHNRHFLETKYLNLFTSTNENPLTWQKNSCHVGLNLSQKWQHLRWIWNVSQIHTHFPFSNDVRDMPFTAIKHPTFYRRVARLYLQCNPPPHFMAKLSIIIKMIFEALWKIGGAVYSVRNIGSHRPIYRYKAFLFEVGEGHDSPQCNIGDGVWILISLLCVYQWNINVTNSQ